MNAVPRLVAIAVIAAAAPLHAQAGRHVMPRDSTSTMRRIGVTDTLGRLKLKMGVDAYVAATAKISADSAESTALARVEEGGKVDSGEMQMEDGHLVYKINVVPNGKNTVRKIYVDAMTGTVVKDRTLGGVNASYNKSKEHRKQMKAEKAAAQKAEEKAARDSTRYPPQ
jgi:uncharacterized membrane protein YkoI